MTCRLKPSTVALLLALGLPSPAQTTEDFRRGVVRITASDGTVGSGFIVEVSPEAAFVLTVSHILEKGNETPEVEFQKRPNRSFRSVIEGTGSGDEGLALLRVAAPFSIGLAALSAAQVSPEIGQSIQVLGFPYSEENRFSVFPGIISSRSGWNIGINAPVGDGSSGGPVVSTDGAVVGILTRGGAGLGTATMASIAQVFLEGYGLNWGTPGLPPPPSDIKGPILRKRDLFREEEGEFGCVPDGGTYEVLMMKAVNNNVFHMRDESSGVQQKYIVSELRRTRAAASRLRITMVPGRRLRIQYTSCGMGGYRHLTYIEPLPASR